MTFAAARTDERQSDPQNMARFPFGAEIRPSRDHLRPRSQRLTSTQHFRRKRTGLGETSRDRRHQPMRRELLTCRRPCPAVVHLRRNNQTMKNRTEVKLWMFCFEQRGGYLKENLTAASRPNTHTHKHTRTNAHTHTRAHIHTYTYTVPPQPAASHTRTHTRTHTHLHIHSATTACCLTHTHTHAHTHTHTSLSPAP